MIKANFIKKAYNNMQLLFADSITYITPNKFTLKAFNYLIYNQEISNPLITNYLLRLCNYYILLYNIKSLNYILL